MSSRASQGYIMRLCLKQTKKPKVFFFFFFKSDGQRENFLAFKETLIKYNVLALTGSNTKTRYNGGLGATLGTD